MRYRESRTGWSDFGKARKVENKEALRQTRLLPAFFEVSETHFHDDVNASLGKNLGSVLAASKLQNQANCRRSGRVLEQPSRFDLFQLTASRL